MGNAVDKFLRKQGKTRTDFPKNSKLGKTFRTFGVPNTPEVERIANLPRYRWQDDEELALLVEDLNDWLGLAPRECPETCVCRGVGSMGLRRIQAAGLAAIHDYGGMLGPIRVGGGKTLLSLLAGVVCGAERVTLLVPAKLKAKTEREFKKLRRHWIGPIRIQILSYELLARDRGVRELAEHNPDLLIADEAQKLKNKKAACTRRVGRFLKANPDCRFVDMSGTITKRSILEYYHRIQWALPNSLQPMPKKWTEVRDWADAIDESPTTTRLMPGALLQFCNEEELDSLSKDRSRSNTLGVTREGYRRRLMETPGVVGTEEMFDGAMGIILTGHRVEIEQGVSEAFEMLREDWCRPDGKLLAQATDIWRHARELACGFYYRWDPEPPGYWLEARSNWSKFARDALGRYRQYDTEFDIAKACDRGDLSSEHLRIWREIRGSFKPNTVPEWLSDTTINWCADWMANNTGIVWVEHVAFGERLAEVTGQPYFGRRGEDKNGNPIEDFRGPCVASIAANCEGRNLQQFSKNLIASTPPGGNIWEQLLGRTHRDGQMADEVTGEVLLSCFEQWEVFQQALHDAEYAERTTGQAQKLLYADLVDIPDAHAVEDREGWAWDKSNAKFFEGSGSGFSDAEVEFASMTAYERQKHREEARERPQEKVNIQSQIE